MKKTIALLLSAALLLPLFAACGDKPAENSGDTADTSSVTEPVATEDTPDPPATTLPAGTRDDPVGVGKSVTVSGLPDTLLIGLAANSGDSKKTSEAVFSDVKINGQTVAFE